MLNRIKGVGDAVLRLNGGESASIQLIYLRAAANTTTDGPRYPSHVARTGESDFFYRPSLRFL